MPAERPRCAPFPPLREAREARGLSANALDRLADLSYGTVRRLEQGVLPPPDRAMCARLERALGLEAGGLWRLAAPARLERLDPELLAWHQALMTGDPEATATENAQLKVRVAELEARIERLRAGLRTLAEEG